MSIQEKLIEFSKATGGDSRPYEEWAELRKELLTEEFTEFVEAIDSRDPLYAQTYWATKQRWHLNITPAQSMALDEMTKTCPGGTQ